MSLTPSHKLCIAPMMTYTDRHFRYLLRLISSRVMLYTEMITTGALLHGRGNRQLVFNPLEHPLAMQLAGREPEALGRCAEMAESAGFDEINLNAGCPSDRAQTGGFGACLVADPEQSADSIRAMIRATRLPVSIKLRTGVDGRDSEEYLMNYIDRVASAGCGIFIIHARKAWLQGLSPRQNRHIPPLQYERVYRIKERFPELQIVINGGFNDLETIREQYRHVDGVMIGRMICNDPYQLVFADTAIFSKPAQIRSRHELIQAYIPYMERELAAGTKFSELSRHILCLFQGVRGARAYRRYLSENIHRADCGMAVVSEAVKRVSTG